MDPRQRLTEITVEILGWALKLGQLIHRVGEIGRRSDIPEEQKQLAKETAERLGKLFANVSKALDEQHQPLAVNEQLIASYDRLTEEMAKANELLERIERNGAR
jgi:hypothetical protein